MPGRRPRQFVDWFACARTATGASILIAHLAVAGAALVAAGLTLFSGFGLGTILLPVFALFFPPPVAVAATAIVHGANNLAKVAVAGRHADRGLVIRFGLPALAAAFVGATLLGFLAGQGESARYQLLGRTAVVTPLKLVLGSLMFVFALFELVPRLRAIRFPRRYQTVGGLVSGFFGGLSGHQGALRAAFLTKAGLSTAAFVGTSATIGLAVDLARLVVYGLAFEHSGSSLALDSGARSLVATGVIAAWAGVALGQRWLGKVTMRSVQTLAGIFLLWIALALGSGWL